MCGIAGILSPRGAIRTSDLTRMADRMVHRGPDDAGTFRTAHVGFAFRRLSILDLSPNGHQPMVSADGSTVIVFNGEIYNHRELRQRLSRRGVRFRSRTDTEVLLEAYRAWGGAALAQLNGMFAFAVYDRNTGVLFLARDPLGIKPLYYTERGNRFAFASEVKALLTLQGVTPRLDPAALNEYLTFQNILSDRTLFAGIRLLPPGHSLTIDRQGTLRQERFWEPTFRPARRSTRAQAVAKLRRIFERAVRRHLVADVPVGSQLSGGMDSGSIVAVAGRSLSHLRTFTAGFDLSLASGIELNFDERADAEVVARHTGSEHYSMLIQAGDMERILPRLIWHLEDLRLGNSYPNYYINQLSAKFVKVVLSGSGGDELFAGYPWRYDFVAGRTDPAAFDAAYYRYWNRVTTDADKPRLYQPSLARTLADHSTFEAYRNVIAPVDTLDPLSKALYFELKTFLHGLLLIEDKVSMAHSLEARVPFLDRELVDFALGLPPEWKLTRGVGKAILRAALAPYLPKSIVHKRKQGFAAPERTWFRRSSVAYLHRTLLSRTSRISEYVRPAFTEAVLRQHLAGRHNHRLLIWSLLSLEWWLRIFLSPEPPAEVAHFVQPAARTA